MYNNMINIFLCMLINFIIYWGFFIVVFLLWRFNNILVLYLKCDVYFVRIILSKLNN